MANGVSDSLIQLPTRPRSRWSEPVWCMSGRLEAMGEA